MRAVQNRYDSFRWLCREVSLYWRGEEGKGFVGKWWLGWVGGFAEDEVEVTVRLLLVSKKTFLLFISFSPKCAKSFFFGRN
jgi:hypothetical protein